MKTKYQIFISSTYQDLKEERDLVIKSILEMGHIPVGMEMFSAADEQQWKIIQKQIDDCDYYILICAHRYGSIDGEISFTEKEYNYATEKNIPTLSFVIDDRATWPLQKSDTDKKKKQKLEQFKSKIKNKIISYWKNKDDLYGKVSIALMKQFTANPRTGWVKANEAGGPEVLNELSRLSKENAMLRQMLTKANEELESNLNEEIEKQIILLKQHTIDFQFMYSDSDEWLNKTKITFFKLFTIIAPELMVEKSTAATAIYLAGMLNPQKGRKLRSQFPVPSNTVKSMYADLFVLKLVTPSKKKHSVKDTNDYWSITTKGLELYNAIRKETIETDIYKKIIASRKK